MKTFKNSQGSIVVFSLLILSIMIILTQQLLKSVYVSSSFIRTMVDRERAEAIAIGGVNIAIELLRLQVLDEEDKNNNSSAQAELNKKKGDKENKDSGVKTFLKQVLPYLNRWRSFTLEEEKEGIAGELKFCISCENGKININKIFDFKKEEFKKEYGDMLKKLAIRGTLVANEIHDRLQEFFKKRKKPITDISELYEAEGINVLDIMYRPPELPVNKKDKSQPNANLALQDIFTVWTDDEFLEPMVFSDGLCAIMGLRRPLADDVEKIKDRFEQVIDNFEANWGSNWNENWRFLQVLYDEKPSLVKNLGSIFSKQFGPTVYSVLSSGKVGDVEQRLLAVVKIIKQDNMQHQDEQKGKRVDGASKQSLADQQNKASQKKKYMFKIIRAYWI